MHSFEFQLQGSTGEQSMLIRQVLKTQVLIITSGNKVQAQGSHFTAEVPGGGGVHSSKDKVCSFGLN